MNCSNIEIDTLKCVQARLQRLQFADGAGREGGADSDRVLQQFLSNHRQVRQDNKRLYPLLFLIFFALVISQDSFSCPLLE